MNRTTFFASARTGVFGGSLKPSQVATIDAVLDAAELRGTPLAHLSYMLATARWEAGEPMAPVEENLFYTKAERIRAVWPSRFPTLASAAPFAKNPRGLANKVYNGRMGNRLESDDGWAYRGRGLVQLTGRDNYARAETKLGIPLVAEPGRALELPVAVALLIDGMEGGWFTGKTSASAAQTDSYVDDRAIINGTDQAKVIAAIAEQFENALRAAGWGAGAPKPPSDVDAPPAEDAALLTALIAWRAEAPVPADFAAMKRINAWLERMPS